MCILLEYFMRLILLYTTSLVRLCVHVENEIRSTVGIDQDLWCYAKSMDNEDGSEHTAIAFYAWDFAGQVR